MIKTKTVTGDEDDLRLDRWFKRHYPDLGHGGLQKLLRRVKFASTANE